MPIKRRSKRTYKRYYRKKWTPYNSEVTVSTETQVPALNVLENASVCIYGSSNSLGTYATASDALSAVNYYVCRVRFNGVISTAINYQNYIIYIAYVPNAASIDNGSNPIQDSNLRTAYFYTHPEYVLAWTRLDYLASTGDTGEVKLYSRIKKRLSPGDRMVVCVLCRNNSTSTASNVPRLQGTFSCYLRTN